MSNPKATKQPAGDAAPAATGKGGTWVPWRSSTPNAPPEVDGPPIPNPEPAPEDVPSGTEKPTQPRMIKARMRTVPLPALAKASKSNASEAAPTRVPSLVLPSFDDTFARPPRVWAPRAGIWERTVGALNAYFFPKGSQNDRRPRLTTALPKQPQHGTAAPHLHAEHEQAMPRAYRVLGDDRTGATRGYKRAKKVVVLGVHGWFAQSIFKNVIGPPVGTSMRFATMMAGSVREHFSEAGCPLPTDAVTIIAPQHDGRVEERTRRFFEEIVQNDEWVQALRDADALMVAAHSQGAVVATLLLDQLLREGVVDAKRTRIGVLSMCGIYQGPFVHLQSSLASSYIHYFETGAARELFEFQTSDSPVSQKHRAAYEANLAAGVKMVHVGSIDDNVVPLYSALYASAAHPSVLRAVYIDGVAFPKTDFLISLIILCVAVRNCGFHDHNLLTLLSASVAGSLYSGLGHSLIYDEPAVYTLATRFLFETNSPQSSGAAQIPLVTTPFAAQRWNPYELPWGLRGLLEDETIHYFFRDDITEVVQDYRLWQPTSKPLKDLQWRLSPMRTVPIPEARPPTADPDASRAEMPERGLSKL
ncbi:hypothetical protein MOBT1_002189 [Malassezia obtusa]|uniref:YMC020W-like alpha/beta hydrolase domain-containing protein n=1 Tax=Malassezia obtusa TaxID=76774 RepID=A0AAF0ITL4_9BASI|nr:hypothetical protein MOBT1_002189 [Malassezia obtusa]